ncbi:mechanosensitive ion channel family protein [Paenibacillus ginsengihumi]|uniref:mechanosensitive ion channel family protein n=1 Tax=Paenibacillus ginsengihumi TaxID=431596 RepID=UPI000367ADEF|nr:mechanosensitive ion channel family protein [Paenibacillus ginsengihumi]
MNLLQSDSAVGTVAAWERIWEDVAGYFSNPELWSDFLLIIIKVAVIYVASRVLVKIANKTLQHVMKEREQNPLKLDSRRTRTLGKLVGNVISYVVNFIMILMILNQFGVSLGPVLAGAGVVGLAVGFGAQSLVKDVITGFFIIFEDQFAVGDVIQIDQFKGTVEEIGLRVTRVRSWTGEVHIIPNGSINLVTNFSVNNSLAVVDVNVALESDIDKATKVLEETAAKAYESDEDIVKMPDVLGVHMIGATGIVLRVAAECKPNTHFPVSRRLNAEIKKAFDQNGIEIPYPRMVTYHKSERSV